ncbi:DUF2889 domain-containing protein [Cupriavidus oxalaticus]|uniref:DUF2889 domain-containing protein n=1 Tax=Cupriavidus oxalaticus TaxID=96344 RepID=UPI004034706A
MRPKKPTLPDRKRIHTRHVTCNGYERADGLFDIEAEMTDITPTGTHLLFKRLGPGEAIHHMRIVITVSRDLVIHDIAATLSAGPTGQCADIASAYAGLKGLQIRAGFRRQASAIVGGVRGCTHLTELLGPLATTARQTIFAVDRRERDGRWHADGTAALPTPAALNTCHAYREDGEVVRLLWPPHRRGAPDMQPDPAQASADSR